MEKKESQSLAYGLSEYTMKKRFLHGMQIEALRSASVWLAYTS